MMVGEATSAWEGELMRQGLLCRVVVVVALALLMGSGDFAAAMKSNEIPMNATFRDDTSDGLRSDTGKSYVNGTEGVRAVLVDVGNFVLDTRESLRSIVLDFGGTPCLGEKTVLTRFFSTARLIDNKGNLVEGRLLGMPLGATYKSAAQAFFTIGDTQYFLRFDPNNDYDGFSEYVFITRTDDVSWVIATTTTGTASLLKQPLRGNPTITFVADCQMPFRLDIACQKAGCAP